MRATLMFAVVAALACPDAARAGGLVGRVLSASGLAVARAVVAAQRIEPGRANALGIAVETDRNGAFELRDLVPGVYDVTFRASGYTAERLRVEVPRSFTITLPAIRLSAECYARARFVSAAGSPVRVNHVVGQSLDVNGVPLADTRDEWTPTPAGADGTVLVGPLPRGITMLGIDLPEFARTRLPDVRVSGADPIVDLGTIVVPRGAALQVRVVDASGAAQANAHVSVAETAALTPFRFLTSYTDGAGTARFDRLGPGTYRMVADGDYPCGTSTPAAERVVDLPGDGAREETLVVGGARVTVQAMRQGAPLIGSLVVLDPERAKPRWPAWWPVSALARDTPPELDWAGSLCTGSTDGEGRLRLSNVPFGPTRVIVQLSTTIWSTVVSIPIAGRSLRVDIPSQAVSVRVERGDTGAPVATAEVSWDSAQGTVRARATATGDVLLDGVPPGPGRLSVSAEGFLTIDRELVALPDVPQEVRLTPLAPPVVVVRVSDADGVPIEDAVVYLDLQDGAAVDEVAPTGPDGVARFNVRRPNTIHVTAWASGYGRASTSTAPRQDADGAISITLPRSQPSP